MMSVPSSWAYDLIFFLTCTHLAALIPGYVSRSYAIASSSSKALALIGFECRCETFARRFASYARPTIRKSLSKEAIRSREAARITGEWLQTEARLQLFIKRWWGEQVR